jgi:hypothetical protein
MTLQILESVITHVYPLITFKNSQMFLKQKFQSYF